MGHPREATDPRQRQPRACEPSDPDADQRPPAQIKDLGHLPADLRQRALIRLLLGTLLTASGRVAVAGSSENEPTSCFYTQGAGTTAVTCSARIFQPASRLTTMSLIRVRTTPGSTSRSPGGRPA